MAENRAIRIGIDLDDVIWDLLGAWISRYNDITHSTLKMDDIKSWDLMSYMTELPCEQVFYMLEQEYFWRSVQLKEGAYEYMKKLCDEHEVYIVTATNHKTVNHKINRLFNLLPFINERQIITAYNKQLINVDILVDDGTMNLCDGNYEKILFDAPHNRSLNEQNIGAMRVHDWEELYNYIDELIKTSREEE